MLPGYYGVPSGEEVLAWCLVGEGGGVKPRERSGGWVSVREIYGEVIIWVGESLFSSYLNGKGKASL